ncbi:Chromodomain-Helicase-Dna-Binding Protein 5 [Manis pentadactyla]|nr:Chromodomain-Helicase-Dna-Binding Protein 5 [Manis pentadactyla]
MEGLWIARWQSDDHDYSFKLSRPTHCFVNWKTARKFDRSQKAKQNNGGSKSKTCLRIKFDH